MEIGENILRKLWSDPVISDVVKSIAEVGLFLRGEARIVSIKKEKPSQLEKIMDIALY